MPNMRQLDTDERAKLARAYMRGGTPPYQAARQTGFMRVAIMEEAIRAMEDREHEETEKAKEQAQTGEEKTEVWVGYTGKTGGTERCDHAAPRFGTFGPVKQAQTTAEAPKSIQSDAPVEEQTDKPQVIYPFLKPGEKKEDVSFRLQTKNFIVQATEVEGQKMAQIRVEDTGRYIMIPLDKMNELLYMMSWCGMAVERLKKE